MTEEVVHPEDVEHPEPTRRDRVAAWLAARCATVEFAALNLAFVVAWALAGIERFPYAGLTLALSIEAILLTVFVLVEQRVLTETQRREADADLKNDAIAADSADATARLLRRIDRKVSVLAREGR